MTVLLGIAVVLVCVIGGYLIEHGNLHVLFQPAEMLVIFGAMTGSFIIAAPMRLVKETVHSIRNLILPKKGDGEHYMELISLLNQLLTKIAKEGYLSIEKEILAKREKSDFFKKFPEIAEKPHIINFLCNSLSVIIDAEIAPEDLDTLLDIEIDTYRKEVMEVPHAVDKIADGLPGLGIVAAVLGVVITMGLIDKPPSVLGESIGAALLGTFMGVLMCYGFIGPMGTHLAHKAKEEVVYLEVVKVALVSFLKGVPTRMTLEFAKRAIPTYARTHEKKK